MDELYLVISGTLAAWVLLLGCLPSEVHSNRFGVRPVPGVNLARVTRLS